MEETRQSTSEYHIYLQGLTNEQLWAEREKYDWLQAPDYSFAEEREKFYEKLKSQYGSELVGSELIKALMLEQELGSRGLVRHPL